ncbi:hypothetical protein J6590_077090 [Homalodisca vitripennis]|nr:hypothetical protein J6590_077090 [Homalodisca vitripennis]
MVLGIGSRELKKVLNFLIEMRCNISGASGCSPNVVCSDVLSLCSTPTERVVV